MCTNFVTPETELFRGIIFIIISDYLKSEGFDRVLSERLIHDNSGGSARHFSFLCDAADFDVNWIRRRVKIAKESNINWRQWQYVGERVLGIIGLED